MVLASQTQGGCFVPVVIKHATYLESICTRSPRLRAKGFNGALGIECYHCGEYLSHTLGYDRIMKHLKIGEILAYSLWLGAIEEARQ
jgi:hypothetical protein